MPSARYLHSFPTRRSSDLPFVLQDASARETYGTDGTKKEMPADVVVLPGSTQEISQIALLCNAERVPIVVRGGGTGYTGGAVPRSEEHTSELQSRLHLVCRPPDIYTLSLHDALPISRSFFRTLPPAKLTVPTARRKGCRPMWSCFPAQRRRFRRSRSSATRNACRSS